MFSNTDVPPEYNVILSNDRSWKWEHLEITTAHWINHYAVYSLVLSSNPKDTIVNHLELSNRQLELLDNYEKMIKKKSIIHNQGIKLGNRKGMYFFTRDGKQYSYTDNDNLFSLFLSLELNPSSN